MVLVMRTLLLPVAPLTPREPTIIEEEEDEVAEDVPPSLKFVPTCKMSFDKA